MEKSQRQEGEVQNGIDQPWCPPRSGLAHKFNVFLRFLILASVFPVLGCATTPKEWKSNGFKVGPNYCKPVAPVSEHWIDFQNDPRTLELSPDASSWWTVFNDPQLNGLMQNAANQNLTLKVAGTRILQAQAVRGIAGGSLFPQGQVGFGSYDRVQTSRVNANNPPASSFDQWTEGFNLSWELDFWGRYRRGIESADAALESSIEGYDNVLVLLLSDVATTYVQIRTLQTQLSLLRQNVESQRESLAIAEARLKGGLSDEVDVLQTRNNVEQTESLIPSTEAALRRANNALCILLGLPPRDLLVELGEGPIPMAPATIATGVPAELLLRRPDIRQAERIAAAQCAQIGIAESALYPRITINGTLQWQSEDLTDLFSAPSSGGAVGASYVWNIFNYGRIRNSIRQQEALFDQAVLNYKDAVIRAQRETEDAMVGFVKAQEQTDSLEEAVNDIKSLESVLLTKAQQGAIDFNRVFVVQAQATVQQDNLSVSRGNIALNLIRVYRALGGGWEIRLQQPQQIAVNVIEAIPLPDEQAKPIAEEAQ